jgi:WS/DGAT/MGAT family acyltransferase
MRQLSGQDAAFLYMENQGAHLHVGGLQFYDPSTAPGGNVSHKDILQHIESRLDTSQVFRQKLVEVPLSLDFPYWVDDNRFDLEFHVRHIGLPSPRDWRQLCILVARLHSRPIDMTRPPWEMYIIEGLDNIDWLPRGSYAILSKYHHAAIDGASGQAITAGLHDLKPLATEELLQAPWTPETPPSMIELLTRATVNNVKTPFRLAKVIAAAVPMLSRNLLQSEDSKPNSKLKAPRTRFNRRVSPNRVFEGRMFALDDFRSIKNQVENATINDAVLTVCGGALMRYLGSRAELPSEPLVAMAPINLRPGEDALDSGNQITAMIANLHTDIDDPIKRMIEVRDTTRESKEIDSAMTARQMTDISQHVPATTLALAGRLITGIGLGRGALRMCNCIISNVPGPQIPMYMNGAEMMGFMAAAPVIDGMGLIIVAMSYNGLMPISFTCCRDIMPDPEFFAQCLQESFDELKQAALGPSGTPRKKALTKPPQKKKAPGKKARKKTTSKKTGLKKTSLKKRTPKKKAAANRSPVKKKADR